MRRKLLSFSPSLSSTSSLSSPSPTCNTPSHTYRNKIRSLVYSSHTRRLLSTSDDGMVGMWNLDIERQEVNRERGVSHACMVDPPSLPFLLFFFPILPPPSSFPLLPPSPCLSSPPSSPPSFPQTAEWGGGSTCEKCSVPFFWNVKDMWSQKTLGVRQVHCVSCSGTSCYVHYEVFLFSSIPLLFSLPLFPLPSQHHCRKCGRAVCATCSNHQSTFPPMGFEIPVRMCNDCHSTITTDE